MNEHFQIIKDNLTILKGYTNDEADEILDICIESAECMATSIELKDEVLIKQTKYIKFLEHQLYTLIK